MRDPITPRATRSSTLIIKRSFLQIARCKLQAARSGSQISLRGLLPVPSTFGLRKCKVQRKVEQSDPRVDRNPRIGVRRVSRRCKRDAFADEWTRKGGGELSLLKILIQSVSAVNARKRS
jgi:hypothetical protein